MDIKEPFSNTYIYITFLYLIVANVWINFDHGVLPASAIQIQRDLDMSNKAFGGLGSIVFIGLTVGSIFATYLFQASNTKILLTVVVLLNSLTLFLFTQFTSYWLCATNRFFAGFFQVFICIYYPVWADRFGGS